METVELESETLLSLIDDPAFVFDRSGTLQEWNAVAERVSGYAPDELGSMHATDLIADSKPEDVGQLVSVGETVEGSLATKTGDRIPYTFRSRVLPDDSGVVCVGQERTAEPFGQERTAEPLGQERTTERIDQATSRHRESVLRRMYEITADRNRSFAEQVRALLELGREELDIEYGTLSRIRGTDYILEFVSADDDSLTEGEIVPLSATHCEIAANREQTLVLSDIARDATEETNRAGYAEWGISCYLGAPVFTDEGIYGTLCFYDTNRRDRFTDWEVTLVDLMSQWVSHELRHQQARKRLEAQNAKLEQFASVVSHDLRNPLNVLSLGLADDGTETAKRNRRAVDRMEALIDDLLLLARAGKEIDTTTDIPLEPLVKLAWDGVETADATLVVDVEVIIQAHERRLTQLLENLFRNAIEHASADVTVTVGLLDDGFYVEDDGPGIAPERRDEVFEGGYSTKTDGTGFGLSIVHEIATSHGWTVVLTEGEAGGARFEFTDVSFA